jgi:hypothetical protein
MKLIQRNSRRKEPGPDLGPLTGSAGRFAAADYAILLSSLRTLLRPGRVEHLLEVAELEGVQVPEDLA